MRTTLRPAFSLITAMFVVVIMSSITAMVIGTASKIVQSTTAQYQREQAMLWAKSYTEFAVMTVMANNRRGANCIDTISSDIDNPLNGQGYRVRIDISFIGTNAELLSCTNNILDKTVITPESFLNVILDVYIDYRDINHPDIANAPWISYHKRTLQKI